MRINVRTVNDVRILDCSGQLTLGKATMAVRNTVRDILEAGGKKIIFNLTDVTGIDSPGIGQLVDSYSTVKAQGGLIKLLNPMKRIQEPLVVTRLITLFEISNNERELLASFPNPAAEEKRPVQATGPSDERRVVA